MTAPFISSQRHLDPHKVLHKEIWPPDLFAALPSAQSGVLLLDCDGYPRSVGDSMRVECVRRATANRDAAPISPAAAVDIARLASPRMWDAYARLEQREAA